MTIEFENSIFSGHLVFLLKTKKNYCELSDKRKKNISQNQSYEVGKNVSLKIIDFFPEEMIIMNSLKKAEFLFGHFSSQIYWVSSFLFPFPHQKSLPTYSKDFGKSLKNCQVEKNLAFTKVFSQD